jgi:hypothetical protein
MQRRLVIAGLAATLAAPVAVIPPAGAAILFTCDSVTGSAVFSPGLVHDPRPQLLSSGPAAPAGAADITLASVTAGGVKGNGQSAPADLSADGTEVVFRTFATNLDPRDSDGYGDIYVKDVTTGALTLASTTAAGVKSDLESGSEPSLSADGTKVAFSTHATNFDPGDTDIYTDVYVKDLTTGALSLVSTTAAGLKGNRDSGSPSLSADGTKLAFLSRATNLNPGDGDTRSDVYVKNLVTGSLRLASTNDADAKANQPSDSPSLSGDGHRVAFDSNATNLDPRATSISFSDVYVKDLTTGDLTLASTNDADVKGNHVSLFPSLSEDGTRVSFSSWSSNLDPEDTDGNTDLYVKNLTTGDIMLASTSDIGVHAGGANGSLSADGTKVAFESSGNLDPPDTSESDVYVKNLATGDVTLSSTSDTGVKGDQTSRLAAISADGTRAAFNSQATNLDAADTDTIHDVYVKELPATPTSIAIGDCSNGNSGTASVVHIRSYDPRPLGCPTSLGGAVGNDYPDTTPILVGFNASFRIDWATGPDSYGVAAAKAGATGTQWRFRLAITASPGHDTPATNQYLPAAGSGATKTRLQGKLDWSALDTFDCASGTADPLSWLHLADNGIWVAKTS